MDYSGWTEVYPSYGGIPRGYRVTLLWHDRVEKGKKQGQSLEDIGRERNIRSSLRFTEAEVRVTVSQAGQYLVGTHADESKVTEGDERLDMGLDSLGTTELVGSLSQEFEAKGRCKDKRQVTKAEGQKTQI